MFSRIFSFFDGLLETLSQHEYYGTFFTIIRSIYNVIQWSPQTILTITSLGYTDVIRYAFNFIKILFQFLFYILSLSIGLVTGLFYVFIVCLSNIYHFMRSKYSFYIEQVLRKKYFFLSM